MLLESVAIMELLLIMSVTGPLDSTDNETLEMMTMQGQNVKL